MEESLFITHRSAAGTWRGTITGSFVGKDPAQQRHAFVESLRASGWRVQGAGIPEQPEAPLETSTPGPSTDAPAKKKRATKKKAAR